VPVEPLEDEFAPEHVQRRGRPVDEIKPERARVDERELEMAEQLIDNFRGDWKPNEGRARGSLGTSH
jgi:hypothetical protein